MPCYRCYSDLSLNILKANLWWFFYGHKLNGNLKAFYDYCAEFESLPFDFVYLTMDPAYYKELKSEKIKVKITQNIFHMLLIAKSDVIITSHGYHSLAVYCHLSNVKFVDVRHGIPYKGYTIEDFKDKHKYTQEWLSSEYFKGIYI